MPRYGIVLERSLGTRHKVASIARIPQVFRRHTTPEYQILAWHTQVEENGYVPILTSTQGRFRKEFLRHPTGTKCRFNVWPNANATKPQAAKQRVPSCLGICHLFSHDSKNGSRIGSLITYDPNLQCQNFTYRGGTITPLKPCPLLSLQFSGSSQSL